MFVEEGTLGGEEGDVRNRDFERQRRKEHPTRLIYFITMLAGRNDRKKKGHLSSADVLLVTWYPTTVRRNRTSYRGWKQMNADILRGNLRLFKCTCTIES